jgi:hypothetical protein
VTINAVAVTMQLSGGQLSPIFINEVLVAGAGSYLYTEQGTATTEPNLIPDPFTFIDQSSVPLSTFAVSAPITVSGLTDGFSTLASISGAATSEYRINGGSWITATASVNNGNTIEVRHLSSSANSTDTNTTLALGPLGQVTDTFTSTTIAGVGYSFTHYASPTGVATYANATNISTPCSIQTAFANATAGDVVGLRGGTYDIGPSPDIRGCLPLSGNGAPGNELIFAAYTGESPVLDGTRVGSASVGVNGNIGCNNIVLRSNKNYITFDGLKFTCDGGLYEPQGILIGEPGSQLRDPSLIGIDNITIKNCEFDGGSIIQAHGDNAAAIRINGGRFINIIDNLIYNYRTNNGYEGPNGIQSYGGHDVVCRNNDIQDCRVMLYLKSHNSNWDIYNNFVRNCDYGIWGRTATHYVTQCRAYNNIIYNGDRLGVSFGQDDTPSVGNFLPTMVGMHVYNNTCVTFSSTMAGPQYWWNNIINEGGTGCRFYNNIAVGEDSLSGDFIRGQVTFIRQDFTRLNFDAGFLDYNLYDAGTFRVTGNNGGITIATSLAQLQGITLYNLASPNHNQNSLEATPVFTNASGSYLNPDDFLLTVGSPGKGAGLGGVDMGADTTTVGIGNGG